MHRLADRPTGIDQTLAEGGLLPSEASAHPTTAALSQSPEAIAATVAIWICAGLVVAAFMIRRGHDAGAWAVLGIAFGPCLLGLAAHWVCRREDTIRPLVVARGVDHGGPTNVLIGVGERDPDLQMLERELDRVDRRLGRVTLASAVDYESLMDLEWNDVKTAAAMRLNRAEMSLARFTPELVVLPGRMDRALERHATTAGFDLVVLARPPSD